MLYRSPPLGDYQWDVSHTNYSPPVLARSSGLAVDASAPLVLTLRFDDNDRNLALVLPLNVTLFWSP